MEVPASPHGIAFVSELRRLDIDDRPFRRAVLRGDVVRIHRGAYVSAEEWSGLDRHERYRRHVIAAALASRSKPVLSHQSAAVLWGVPLIGEWPKAVHVLTTISAGTRTENGFHRHASETLDDEIVESDGVRFTSFARTLIDLAKDTTFASAVAGLDWSLRAPSRGADPRVRIEALRQYVELHPIARNRRKVQRALGFANPLAESPGESLSRVVIHELGFPAPELQSRVDDARGLIGISDFAWPELRLLGEFDGLVKYTRDLARAGESIEDVVVREKVREDRMRATGRGMTRWLWSDALQVRPLYDKLLAAGLPSTHRGPVYYKRGRYIGPIEPDRPGLRA
ncbi:MAG: type IV toxin-antitoxin system AbiEi family antitoxin domain-containing protein [Rhodoglobus sp.]